MDLNSILPLLLGNNEGMDKAKIFSMLAGGGNNADILKDAYSGNMNGIINLLSKNMNKKTQASAAMGLSAITEFAPSDIIGTLFKLLNY